MRRHRWIIDRWVWEMPGGYVDDHEENAALSATREVEEETGWRPRTMEFLCSFQPMVGTADAENLLFLARRADDTGAPPDINEAQQLRWIPLDDAIELTFRTSRGPFGPPTCGGQCFADRGGWGGTVGRRRSSPAAAEICSIWATTCSRCRRLVIQLR
jgi:hypothetical protein